MKIKVWLRYLIYIILIFFLILLREYVDKLFSASYYRFEIGTIICNAVISLLLGVCIGLLLGSGHFIREISKEGTWKINLPKLIIVGLPSLYFSLTNILIFSGSQFLQDTIAHPLLYLVMRHGSGYISLFQIILGYVVITSFFRDSEKTEVVQ